MTLTRRIFFALFAAGLTTRNYEEKTFTHDEDLKKDSAIEGLELVESRNKPTDAVVLDADYEEKTFSHDEDMKKDSAIEGLELVENRNGPDADMLDVGASLKEKESAIKGLELVKSRKVSQGPVAIAAAALSAAFQAAKEEILDALEEVKVKVCSVTEMSLSNISECCPSGHGLIGCEANEYCIETEIEKWNVPKANNKVNTFVRQIPGVEEFSYSFRIPVREHECVTCKNYCCRNDDCDSNKICQRASTKGANCECQAHYKWCGDSCIPNTECCIDQGECIVGEGDSVTSRLICRPFKKCQCPSYTKWCASISKCIDNRHCCDDSDCKETSKICDDSDCKETSKICRRPEGLGSEDGVCQCPDCTTWSDTFGCIPNAQPC